MPIIGLAICDEVNVVQWQQQAYNFLLNVVIGNSHVPLFTWRHQNAQNPEVSI